MAQEKSPASVAKKTASEAPARSASTTVEGGARPVNPYAALALGTGIAGLCGVFPAAIAAIVLGHVGLSSLKRGGERGRGSAIFGLVAGYLSIVWAVIALAVIIPLSIFFVQQQIPNMINDATSGFTSGLTDSMGSSLMDQMTQSGLVQDPATGFMVDPNSGQMFDPNTGQEIDPATGQPYS